MVALKIPASEVRGFNYHPTYSHDALEDSRTCGQIIKLAADRLALLTVIIRAILLLTNVTLKLCRET